VSRIEVSPDFHANFTQKFHQIEFYTLVYLFVAKNFYLLLSVPFLKCLHMSIKCHLFVLLHAAGVIFVPSDVLLPVYF